MKRVAATVTDAARRKVCLALLYGLLSHARWRRETVTGSCYKAARICLGMGADVSLAARCVVSNMEFYNAGNLTVPWRVTGVAACIMNRCVSFVCDPPQLCSFQDSSVSLSSTGEFMPTATALEYCETRATHMSSRFGPGTRRARGPCRAATMTRVRLTVLQVLQRIRELGNVPESVYEPAGDLGGRGQGRCGTST
eukprot:1422029-Rhodomonas_salina.1